MSLPNFPNITPTISLGRGDVVNLLLASIAIEELSLAHILNAEGEKIQLALGTLGELSPAPTLEEILEVNDSVRDTLAMAIKELLLDNRMRQVLSLTAGGGIRTDRTAWTAGPTGPEGPQGPHPDRLDQQDRRLRKLDSPPRQLLRCFVNSTIDD